MRRALETNRSASARLLGVRELLNFNQHETFRFFPDRSGERTRLACRLGRLAQAFLPIRVRRAARHHTRDACAPPEARSASAIINFRSSLKTSRRPRPIDARKFRGAKERSRVVAAAGQRGAAGPFQQATPLPPDHGQDLRHSKKQFSRTSLSRPCGRSASRPDASRPRPSRNAAAFADRSHDC